jgi:hypothetical protein
MRTKVGLPGSAKSLLAMFEIPAVTTRTPRALSQRVIMVDRHDGDYVVSTQNSKTPSAVDDLSTAVDGQKKEPGWVGSWNQGHYFDSHYSAKHAFIKNVARGHVTNDWGNKHYEQAYDLVCDQLITGLDGDGLRKILDLVGKAGR